MPRNEATRSTSQGGIGATTARRRSQAHPSINPDLPEPLSVVFRFGAGHLGVW